MGMERESGKPQYVEKEELAAVSKEVNDSKVRSGGLGRAAE